MNTKTVMNDNIVESQIEDVHTEMQIVGSFYIHPDLFLDYGELIFPKYDFYHETASFLFNSIKEIYYYHVSEKREDGRETRIDEVKINIYMNQDEERSKKWKRLKGYSYIERIMNLVDIDDFSEYFNKFKKYSLLREYERKGFPAKKILEKKGFEKATPDSIVNAMEYEVINIGTKIGGIEDSIILGKDMSQVVQKWRETPDFGEDIPFDIINQLIRGWRKKKFLLLGLHSGCGKSRITSKVVCFMGIKNHTPILVLVNEQDKDEWDAMILASVINNPEFHSDDNHGALMKKYRIKGIDETKIVTATYNELESDIVDAAAEWIQDNSCIHFMVLGQFSPNVLKRQIKRHKIRNKCDYVVYDTLKADTHDWVAFVETGNMLKQICMDLDIGIFGTFQLTDDSLFDEILTSKAIANGKHIKHICDHLFMAKPLSQSEFEKYVILVPEDELNDSRTISFDVRCNYYMVFVDKNRGGKDKDRIVLEVNKGQNKWQEKGFAVESDDLKEQKELKKEYSRLKKEKDVRNMKVQLGKDNI